MFICVPLRYEKEKFYCPLWIIFGLHPKREKRVKHFSFSFNVIAVENKIKKKNFILGFKNQQCSNFFCNGFKNSAIFGNFKEMRKKLGRLFSSKCLQTRSNWRKGKKGGVKGRFHCNKQGAQGSHIFPNITLHFKIIFNNICRFYF